MATPSLQQSQAKGTKKLVNQLSHEDDFGENLGGTYQIIDKTNL